VREDHLLLLGAREPSALEELGEEDRLRGEDAAEAGERPEHVVVPVGLLDAADDPEGQATERRDLLAHEGCHPRDGDDVPIAGWEAGEIDVRHLRSLCAGRRKVVEVLALSAG
jgi:hypothetical protein